MFNTAGKNRKQISLLEWNANKLNNKIAELNFLLKQNQYEHAVVCVCETKISAHGTPGLIPGYQAFYKNRNQHGGGVAIYVRNDVDADEVETNTVSIESVAVKINNVLVVGIYKPPAGNFNMHEVNSLIRLHSKVILLGDFNAKNRAWGCSSDNRLGVQLLGITDLLDLEVDAPTEPTFISRNANLTPSILDIAVSKNVRVKRIFTLEELNSDHRPVQVDIAEFLPPEHETRILKNYSKANWPGFKREINSKLSMQREFLNPNELEIKIRDIETIISTAVDNNVPNVRVSNQDMPREITEAVRERNIFRKRWQRGGRSAQGAEILHEMNQTIKTMLWSFNEHKWHNKIRQQTNDHGCVWKLLKNRKRGNKRNIPTLVENNVSFKTTQQKTNLLAGKFSNANAAIRAPQRLTERTVRAYDEVESQQFLVPLKEQTSPREIKNVIKNLRPMKAPGFDGIQNRSLKMITQKMTAQLFYIFNYCIKEQYYPQQWKNAKVIPILKPGKNPKNAENYRPISLLPSLGKVYDKIILARLNKDLEANNFIIDEQFGFVKGKNADLQLARIINKAMLNNNAGKVTGIVALDLKKAYDTVWHQALIYKMRESNTASYLTRITLQYLKNRTIQVEYKETQSERIEIERGLPQGSCLSPTLFNIFINDIPKPNDTTTSLALFADDVAIVTESTEHRQAMSYAQRHVDFLVHYFDKWQLTLNIPKTAVMFLTKKYKQYEGPSLQIRGQAIELSNDIKYLGVTLDKGLTFTRHINNVKAKGYGVLKIIRPYIKRHIPMSQITKTLIYKAYLRSTLLYAAPVWSSASKTNINKLEVLERRALRNILGVTKQDIHNDDVYQRTNTRPLRDVIRLKTDKFFTTKIHQTDLTRDIGMYNRNEAPFRVKHKLINDLLHR